MCLINAVDDHMPPVVKAAIGIGIVDLGPKMRVVRDQFERIATFLRLRHPNFRTPPRKACMSSLAAAAVLKARDPVTGLPTLKLDVKDHHSTAKKARTLMKMSFLNDLSSHHIQQGQA